MAITEGEARAAEVMAPQPAQTTTKATTTLHCLLTNLLLRAVAVALLRPRLPGSCLTDDTARLPGEREE